MCEVICGENDCVENVEPVRIKNDVDVQDLWQMGMMEDGVLRHVRSICLHKCVGCLYNSLFFPIALGDGAPSNKQRP